MKNTIFEGVATALVTPMNEDGSINFDRLRTLIDEQIEAGVPALVICGTKDMIKESHTKEIAKSIPNAKLAIIKGDHFIANKNPIAFNKAVEDFLETTNFI